MFRCFWIVMVLLALLPCMGRCSTTDWGWTFAGSVCAGTNGSASDNLDSQDIPMQEEPCAYHVAVYKDAGDGGWTEAAGFFKRDIRAPLQMVPGASKTWRILMWGDTSMPEEAWYLSLPWWYAGRMEDAPLSQIEFRLTYVRPAVGIPGQWTPPVGSSPDVGTSILLNTFTEWSWMFPIHRTENGLDGYVFDLTAKVVPEPSALAGLMGGLGALGIPLLRRRR